MNTYITEIQALDEYGNIQKWAGPKIKAGSFEEAKQYCDDNGLGYCRIVGEFLFESDHSEN